MLLSSCGENQSKTAEPRNARLRTEPTGDNRKHYDFLIKECDTNEKLIEESGYTKNAAALGRRNYCTEAEEMRERMLNLQKHYHVLEKKEEYAKTTLIQS